MKFGKRVPAILNEQVMGSIGYRRERERERETSLRPFSQPGLRERERETEKLHYVHSASLAYEDGSVFMSGPTAEWL